MTEYVRETKSFRKKVKVELDLSNNATNADFQIATSAKKVDLANLKSDVEKLDNDKFKNAPTNLSNLKSEEDKLDVDKISICFC